MADAPDKVLRIIQGLLNKAAATTHPEEAASFTSKAQEYLEEWNLTVADVENAHTEDGRREDAKVRGGFYKWQRWLWQSIAQLNFCLYWTQAVWEDKPYRTRTYGWRPGRYRNRHRLVGRIVNVRATQNMAQYLEGEIERLLSERTRGIGDTTNSNWAVSFRTGAASQIVQRLEDRRRERVDNAARLAKEAAERAGASTATALTIADVEQRERDSNQDFVFGEGWSAKKAAERSAAAEEARLEREEYTRWASENPEEAAAEEREARERFEKQKFKRHREAVDKLDYSAYYTGFDTAKDISLDQQLRDPRNTPRLPRARL